MKRYIVIFLLIISVIIISIGCGVKRNIVQEYDRVDAKDYKDIIEINNLRGQYLKNIKATLDIDISIKGNSISSSAQFICNKGQCIKITLIPFPFIEAARIWFTRDGVYIWDKINSVRAAEPYDSFSQKLGLYIDYSLVESIFLGGIFTKDLPVKENNVTKCIEDKSTSGYILQGKTNNYTYNFMLNSSALVDSVRIESLHNMNNIVECNISGFQEPMSNIFIPISENISVKKSKQNMLSLYIDWKKVKVNVDDLPDTEVRISNNTTLLSLDDILNYIK